MLLEKLIKEFDGVPCYVCKNKETASSLFGTLSECSKNVENWENIFEGIYPEQNIDLNTHCSNICSEFEEGEGKYYSFG